MKRFSWLRCWLLVQRVSIPHAFVPSLCLPAKIAVRLGPPSKICCATYSPIAGPCLNPCPEPPPANHTLFISGCRSIKKSPFGSIFVLAHARFHDWCVCQGREALCHVSTHALDGFRRHHARLRVGINALAVTVESDLESARFKVRHTIHFVCLESARSAAMARKIGCLPAARQKRKPPGGWEIYAGREFQGIFFQATRHRQKQIAPPKFARHRWSK